MMKPTAPTETAGIPRAKQERTEYLVYAAVAEEVDASLKEGREPDVESLVSSHPELAAHIRELVPTLVTLHQLGHEPGSKGPGAPVSEEVTDTPGRLGDYRIIREVGRGGMGVVYEASQISLNRRVALKVLPFAAVLDKRQLQRFKNEAQAAAQLHHTNIVPVFSVGCERGVHYYAMQYIEGHTLADTVAELRHLSGLNGNGKRRPARACSDVTSALTSGRWAHAKQGNNATPPCEAATVKPDGSSAVTGIPSKGSSSSPEFFRSVAGLGVQAASALDHAHESGILHRDIKPSNLLLDESGKLWITDFGLAQVQSDPGITMTGDLLGTPRYMSPEQAMAKRIPVDHRTDIYSLGVTLYELSTLHPAFTGPDRQEVLRQIAFDEPRMPRRVNPAMPAELETIVLKAISKSPVERYDSAQDFADDLQRFLDDKPIQAKRPTLIERAAKWARRHRSVVASAAILLVLAVAGLAISTVLIAQEQARTAAALAQAQANYETAETERERAAANFQKARDAVDKMLMRVGEELWGVPHMQQIQRALFEDALEFYEGFLQERTTDPALRYDTAHACSRVGGLCRSLGRFSRSEETFRRGIALLEALSAEFPSVSKYRKDLAQTYWNLAVLLKNHTIDRPGALEAYRRSSDLRVKLVGEFPDDPQYVRDLAWTHVDLGLVLSNLYRYEEALEELRQALALREQLVHDFPDVRDYRSHLAHAHHWLGSRLWDIGQVEEAEKQLRQCLTLREELVGEFPEDSGGIWERYTLAHAQLYLGALLMDTGRDQEGEHLLRRAIELLDGLTADFPHNTDHRQQLASGYELLGEGLWAADRVDEAEELIQRAIALRERMVADFPNTLTFAWSLLDILVNCPDPRLRDLHRAVQIAQQCVQQHPEHYITWRSLGEAYYRAGNWTPALDALHRWLEFPAATEYRWPSFYLAMAYWQLRDETQARQWYDEGLEWIENNQPTVTWVDELRAEAAELMGIDEEPASEGQEGPFRSDKQ